MTVESSVVRMFPSNLLLFIVLTLLPISLNGSPIRRSLKYKRSVPDLNFGRGNSLNLPWDGGWLGNGQIGRQSGVNVNPNTGGVQFGRNTNVLGLYNRGDNWMFDPKSLQFGRQEQRCIGGICMNRNIGLNG